MVILSTSIDDYSHYTNIVFVNNTIREYSKFVSSLNDNTGYLVYSNNTTKSDILGLLRSKLTRIERLAFANYSISLFLDNLAFFSDSNDGTDYDANTQFIIDIIKEFQIKHIDFLACNSLNYPKWQKYYNVLTKETGIIIGASDDLTGNLKYGGDWIMENTCENIESIYFNENIKYYEYLFDQGYSSAIVINGYLLVCGRNTSGQLGLGDTGNRPTFNLVTIPGKTIKQVSCGVTHTAVVTNDGLLYMCGSNSSGQLGLGDDTTNQIIFTEEKIPGKIIKQVSCSYLQTIVVTSSGELYICGIYFAHRFSNFTKLVFEGQENKWVEHAYVTGDNLDYSIITAVTSDMKILMNKSDFYYDEYHQVLKAFFNELVNLDSVISSPIKQITTSFVLTTDGKLYNINYYENVISEIAITGKTIKQISSGNYNGTFNALVTTDGELHMQGEHYYGQLGLGDYSYFETFTKVETPSKQIKQVYCYGYHSVIVTTDLEIYTSGLNGSRQLGLGDTVYRNTVYRNTFTKVELSSNILDLLNPPPPPPISKYIQFGNPNSITGSPTIPVTSPFMMKSLFTDNSRYVYKPGSLASCGVGTTTNSRRKYKYT